jgi:Ala-tRNA(Pro) deacylase
MSWALISTSARHQLSRDPCRRIRTAAAGYYPIADINRRLPMLALQTLKEALDRASVEYDVLEHPRTETARAEAQALGLDADDVAKTLVVKTPEGYLRVVLPASGSLDLQRLRELVGGGHHTHLASEEDLAREYPEFELGAVPPFGGVRADRVLIDTRIVARDRVVFEAGDHSHSIRVRAADLMRAAHDPEIVDVCRTTE